MKLEIVTTTLDETLLAKEAGADRVELVSGITEGALTPTYGSLKGIWQHAGVAAYCMIRPHNHVFVYSEHDIEEMIADIQNLKGMADHFVLGCLKEDRTIDEEHLQRLLEACGDTPVVFHKALDQTVDQMAALRTLARYPQIKRVLSNYQAKRIDQELPRLQQMMNYALSLGLQTTFAGGIQLETLPLLAQIGATDVHISSAARIEGKAANLLDPQRIRQFRQACDQ